MSISELISLLQYELASHGDVTVGLADWNENYEPAKTCESCYYDGKTGMLVLDAS